MREIDNDADFNRSKSAFTYYGAFDTRVSQPHFSQAGQIVVSVFSMRLWRCAGVKDANVEDEQRETDAIEVFDHRGSS